MLESIIDYFSNIPSIHRTLFIAAGLTIFFLLESVIPLFSLNYKRWKHAGINLFFTLTTITINFLLAFILVGTSYWVVDNQFGILQWISMPLFIQLILGLLILDFVGAWLVHYIEHHVTWMWKFHVVHHTDQHVDTTTANRHHPGESVIRLVFAIVATIVAGAPMWLVFLYQSLSVILSQFNHSNITLPGWLDRILVTIICTPDMHRVHHHYRMPYSDSNYGNIFSFWDRIFQTFKRVNNKNLVYGCDTYMNDAEANDIVMMLKIPFIPYRKTLKYPEEEIL